jgi:hypothetical protein
MGFVGPSFGNHANPTPHAPGNRGELEDTMEQGKYIVAQWTNDSPTYGHVYLVQRGAWTFRPEEAARFSERIARNWAARLRNLFGLRTWVVPVADFSPKPPME